MIDVYSVYSKLHGDEKLDKFTKELCQEFLSRHPLKWWKDISGKYTAVDESGRDYVFIRERNGKFFIEEGCYFDATFSPDTTTKTDSLAEAIVSANEILSNVGLKILSFDLSKA